MRAITLWQPWASLVAEGVKTIETRPKPNPWCSVIGETIAIHAAKREPVVQALGDYAVIPAQQWQRDALREEGAFTLNGPLGWRFMPLGAVVATCTLSAVVPMLAPGSGFDHAPDHVWIFGGEQLWLKRAGVDSVTIKDQRRFGDFAAGRWALLLDDVRKCEPFPCRGHHGLWTVPERVATNLVSRAA